MKKITQTIYHPIIGTIGTGAILLLASGASAQNIFVSDYQTGDIYEYTSGGVQSTFATGLINPAGLAFDSSGDLFAAAQGNGNIYEFINSGGTLSSTATLYASGFSTPAGLAFDGSGNLYVANSGGNDIIQITPGKVQSTFANGLNDPLGLAFNSAGNLFVGNAGNGVITEITPGKSQSPFASGLSNPWGMAFNSTGNLYVGNLNGYGNGAGSITKITSGATESTLVSGLTIPDEIAFNNAGDLLLAAGTSPNILEYTPSGTLLQTITISGAQNLNGLALQGVTLPVPEPSALAVLALGAAGFFFRKYRKNA
jgi:sugar lactone lactonase YvrE